MSRLARTIIKSRVYHILFREVNQQNIFETTDANGNVTTYTYDSRGNLVKETKGTEVTKRKKTIRFCAVTFVPSQNELLSYGGCPNAAA